MSVGRAGRVVVVVVVVVVSPGSVDDVVVVVVVGASVVVVSTMVVVVAIVVVVVSTVGQLVVRTLLVCRAGGAGLEAGFVVGGLTVVGLDGVVSPLMEVVGAAVVAGGSVSTGIRASVSAGAAAGGSLCSQVSSWSTMPPSPLLRAHEARLCCTGSFELAST